LTDFDKDKVAARLRERAEEIAARREGLDRSSNNMNEAELADYDQHPADQGTETFEQEMDETTDMVLAEEARQVEVAQQRLEAGEYGKCEDCGKEIPAARLEAIPEATRCIDDQSRYEAGLRMRGGPPQAAV
jgi:RNA polymerase-binding transcription factor DksA